jgi:hypothetical protein
LPLGKFFLGSTLRFFVVYVACPRDDVDKFMLPLDQIFFCQAFLQKNLTLDNFVHENTLKSLVTPKPPEQFDKTGQKDAKLYGLKISNNKLFFKVTF